MINPEIKRILNSYKIGDIGLMYLLAIYHGLDINLIPNTIKNQINRLGIVDRDLTTKLPVWKIPLYEGQRISGVWEWVKEWVELFRNVNPERGGVWKHVVGRMQTFFSEHPDVRAHEVIEATKLYISGLDNAKFCKMSHKFIYEGSGKNKVSMLANYVEIYRRKNSRLRNNNLMK